MQASRSAGTPSWSPAPVPAAGILPPLHHPPMPSPTGPRPGETTPIGGKSSTPATPTRQPATGPRPTVIHHAPCFLTKDRAELTTDQAVQALRSPGARACDACGADQLHARRPILPPG
ncbi:DUF6233 domain-containing protein [Streptomyces roseoverticillatus]|uniref:DUF6233 domain-containing protein n=1 Tax=Streptomyces roseoverticillatus TaxID=66429 RepID=A0ABV3IX65_9ACTN